MTLDAEDLDAEARRLMETMRKPVRRARPRLAQQLVDAEDLEVQAPGGAVMAWRLGAGPATLMVHGWEDDNALWGPLIDQCAQIGRAAVAFDLPGHGYSPAEDCSVEAAGRAVIAVAEALGPIDSVVAHSFGCPATMWALADGLAAERVVMIASPAPRTQARAWSFDQWRDRRLNDGERPEVVERAVELLTARMQAETPFGFDVEAALPGMTAKALVIHAIDDEQCPVGNSQRMARLWPGVELVLVDDLGHRLVAQDDAVLTRIIDFVEGFA